jgi:hypothetical protein
MPAQAQMRNDLMLARNVALAKLHMAFDHCYLCISQGIFCGGHLSAPTCKREREKSLSGGRLLGKGPSDELLYHTRSPSPNLAIM